VKIAKPGRCCWASCDEAGDSRKAASFRPSLSLLLLEDVDVPTDFNPYGGSDTRHCVLGRLRECTRHDARRVPRFRILSYCACASARGCTRCKRRRSCSLTWSVRKMHRGPTGTTLSAHPTARMASDSGVALGPPQACPWLRLRPFLRRLLQPHSSASTGTESGQGSQWSLARWIPGNCFGMALGSHPRTHDYE